MAGILSPSYVSGNLIKPEDVGWQIKLQRDPSEGRKVRMQNFSFVRRVHAGVFPLHGRDESGVADGQIGGRIANFDILVRSAAEEEAVTSLLLSRRNLLIQTSLGQEFVMRVTSDLTYEQKLGPSSVATTGRRVQHVYSITGQMTEVQR